MDHNRGHTKVPNAPAERWPSDQKLILEGPAVRRHGHGRFARLCACFCLARKISGAGPVSFQRRSSWLQGAFHSVKLVSIVFSQQAPSLLGTTSGPKRAGKGTLLPNKCSSATPWRNPSRTTKLTSAHGNTLA